MLRFKRVGPNKFRDLKTGQFLDPVVVQPALKFYSAVATLRRTSYASSLNKAVDTYSVRYRVSRSEAHARVLQYLKEVAEWEENGMEGVRPALSP